MTVVKARNLKQVNCRWKTCANYAAAQGEPATLSGRQEYLENLINRYI